MSKKREACKTNQIRINLDRDMANDLAKLMRQRSANVAVINLINDFVLRNKNRDLWSVD